MNLFTWKRIIRNSLAGRLRFAKPRETDNDLDVPSWRTLPLGEVLGLPNPRLFTSINCLVPSKIMLHEAHRAPYCDQGDVRTIGHTIYCDRSRY